MRISDHSSVRFVLCAWFVVLAVALTRGRASTQGGDIVFRAGTQEVLVDAVVIDKKGTFQRNLTQKDFHLFEDGKEQKITSFSLESVGIPGHAPKHFLALVFESEEPGLRDRVMQFVDRFASPDLYLAVFSKVNGQMRLQQAFTADPSRVKAAVRSMPEAVLPSRDPKHPNQSILDMFLDRISSVATAVTPVRGRKAMVFFS
jgi:VWFA-related protein